MVNEWLYILCILLGSVSFLCFRYYPFRSSLRVSVRVLVAIHCLLLLVEAAAYLQIYRTSGQVFYTHGFWLREVFVLIYCVFSLYLVRMDVHRQLYVIFPLLLYELAVFGVAMQAEHLAEGQAALPEFLVPDLVLLALLLLSLPLVLRVLRHIGGLLPAGDIADWKWGWGPAASFYLLEMLYIYSPMREDGSMLLSRMASFAAVSVYLFFQVWFLRIRRRHVIRHQNLCLSQELANQQAYLHEEAAKQPEEMAASLEALLARLQEAAQHHDVAAVRQTAEAGREILAGLCRPEPFCSQEALDALLSLKEAQARRDGVQMEMDAQLEETLRVEEEDLCLLAGSLLDNALEASLLLPARERWVSFRLARQGGDVTIAVDNSCAAGTIRREGEVFYSAKRGGEAPGIGISSVHDIVCKYGGNAEFDYADGVFHARVALPDS